MLVFPLTSQCKKAHTHWMAKLKARIFVLVDLRIFQKVEHKFYFFLFHPPTLSIICFAEKIIYFLGSACIILESDCHMQENNEIFKDLIQTVGVLY